MQFFCLQINMVMTSSRQLWAFARDKGLPFHSFLARVKLDGLPRNAVLVTLAFTALLLLIIIGSSAAFNIILSFGNAGLFTSYITILCCIIWRRFDKTVDFPPTQFSLGRWGLSINIARLDLLARSVRLLFYTGCAKPKCFGDELVVAHIRRRPHRRFHLVFCESTVRVRRSRRIYGKGLLSQDHLADDNTTCTSERELAAISIARWTEVDSCLGLLEKTVAPSNTLPSIHDGLKQSPIA